MPELNALRSTALAWLGRQEYYLAKFRQKLKQHEANELQIELIVEEFCQNNWLSEQRYCNGFVRGRISKGQGKIRIKADARQKGLDEDFLNQALDETSIDWFEQAYSTYAKRFGDKPIVDMKDKAKRLRFMQYRGFTMDEVSHAIAQCADEDSEINEDCSDIFDHE